MLESQTWLLLIPEHLYVSSPPFLTIFSQLTPRCKWLPNLISMHLFVSLNLVPFVLVIFHCLILNFPPTKEVPVLTDCLILSLPGMNSLGLVIVFVVVVNTLVVDEQAGTVDDIRTISFIHSNSGVRVRKKISAFQNYLLYLFFC